jgi:hypothetical protein
LSILGAVVYDNAKKEYRMDAPVLMTVSKAFHLNTLTKKLRES